MAAGGWPQDWTAGPPTSHPREIVGSFRLFAA
jgi:hypothetical protein